ncbi:MAG TPA: MFS transporter [Dongiaceae bacterium]|jgi:MFS family permease|nr:MFS transporter [Dongiaceae bacterium]
MVSAQVWNTGMARAEAASVIETDVPARLDRLPWGRFHTLVVVALGITWILDGLEVTLAGSVAGVLKEGATLGLSNNDIGRAGSTYVAGAVLGAILFGWLTDRLGRRRLFFITLAVYMTAAIATGLSWNLASFLLFRFLTGAGIGGEYAAINSTIQELVPCRYRGWTDLAINGSFWVGAALGAGGSVVLLDPNLLAVDIGWRLCFMIGAALSIVIFVMRLWLPESPRWLLTHGRAAEAAAVVTGIERRFEAAGQKLPPAPLARARFRGRNVGLREVLHSLFWVHRQRALVGLSLMAAQAFFYNAIFFTYALVLTDFYGVPADRIGWYILPFAAGNFLGPLLLGHFFDSIGRKPMIAGTYILSGLLLAVSGYLFQQGQLSATGQTVAWMIVFFFASAAASSAYLTVSETFPLEVRAMAIAVFYAIGTGLGGIAGPLLFGRLIETGSRQEVFIGYLIGAALMLGAAVVLLIWGVAAERKPLETVCRPLTLAD